MAPFDVRDLLRLQSIPGLGPLKISALIAHFGSPEKVLSAQPRQLHVVPGISKKLATIIHRHSAPEDLISAQLRSLNRVGGTIISLWDSRYPPLLRKIYAPPVLLYALGEAPPADRPLLAIVGTRTPTSYGERVVMSLVEGLAEAGYGIVSGLARGIDTMAHTQAVRSGTMTCGVLGSGLDRLYPRENIPLMREICDRRGSVLTEFAMGTAPDGSNFPRRNRIVSGMAEGVVVIESAKDGGAMITASIALDQNREVFAVPGPIFNPMCDGPHTLIHEGRAKLVQTVDAILEELPRRASSPSQRTRSMAVQELSMFEQHVFEILSDNPLHVDTIAERTSISMADTLVALLGLEFKKRARQLPGRYFISLH